VRLGDCRRAAEKRYERASIHSITWSARASKAGGMSRPSVLAVLGIDDEVELRRLQDWLISGLGAFEDFASQIPP
jgi:hypothetical protein